MALAASLTPLRRPSPLAAGSHGPQKSDRHRRQSRRPPPGPRRQRRPGGGGGFRCGRSLWQGTSLCLYYGCASLKPCAAPPCSATRGAGGGGLCVAAVRRRRCHLGCCHGGSNPGAGQERQAAQGVGGKHAGALPIYGRSWLPVARRRRLQPALVPAVPLPPCARTPAQPCALCLRPANQVLEGRGIACLELPMVETAPGPDRARLPQVRRRRASYPLGSAACGCAAGAAGAAGAGPSAEPSR